MTAAEAQQHDRDCAYIAACVLDGALDLSAHTEQNRCVNCGKGMGNDVHKTCRPCRESMRRAAQALKERRKA
jgi:hypothetical protein